MSEVTNYTPPLVIENRLESFTRKYKRLTTEIDLSTLAIIALLTVVVAAIVITLFVFPVLVLIPIVAGSVGSTLLYLLWIKKIEDHRDELDVSIQIENAAILQFQRLSNDLQSLHNKIKLKRREKADVENLVKCVSKSIFIANERLKESELLEPEKTRLEAYIAEQDSKLIELQNKKATLDTEISEAPSADSNEVTYLKAKLHVLKEEVERLKKPATKPPITEIKIFNLEQQIEGINKILESPANLVSKFDKLVEEGKI